MVEQWGEKDRPRKDPEHEAKSSGDNTDEHIPTNQLPIGKMLKAVFYVYGDATYYQGLNGVMSLVQREFEERDAAQIFEGLLLYHLWYAHVKQGLLAPGVRQMPHPGVPSDRLRFQQVQRCGRGG